MQERAFRKWLRDVKGHKKTVVASRLANCRRVEKHKGDLDTHWNKDGLNALLRQFEYSKEDQRSARPPKHGIRIDGNPYTGTQTLKQAIGLYREFLDAQDTKKAEDSAAERERWNRYLEDVQRYVESGKLDTEEVLYKLRIGDALRKARRAALARRSDWQDLLKAATQGQYHPMDWRDAAKLRQWIDDEPDAVLRALRALWTEEDRSISERIRGFSNLYPWESVGGNVPPRAVRHSEYGANGRGTRLRTISVLLMALDPSEYPPFMRSVFDSAYRRLGIEVLPGETAEEDQYEHALGFLDELIRRTSEHAVERPSTRLEAQSVVWALREDGQPPERLPVSGSRPCWFVGASFGEGTEDQTDRFVREGIWEHGGAKGDQFLEQVKSIEPGDRIAIKATYLKKRGLPFDNQDELTSTMAIKAIGEVRGNPGDGRRLRVDWERVDPHREWYFFTFIPRVWKVSPQTANLPWAAAALIDFAFNLAAQDYDLFLRYWYPERYEEPRVRPPERAKLSDTDIAPLAEELLYDKATMREVTRLLDDKRQVIFQGPPGTGKTYAAREMARFLAESEERVTLVQFHPSYAYEDFVQGFRPTLTDGGQAGFKLRPGPLVTASAAARKDQSGAPHFLIIDEINRGNLAKVFGELYFLLEYRDEDMRLQYASADDEPFSLPENLYIIGTMNTADRSIALVDLALRRRFHFVEFHPDKAPVEGLLDRWLEKNSSPDMGWVADVMKRANSRLNDRQAAIGPSYFMKEDLDEEKVRLIWEHNVLPYVEEHLYGESDRLAEFDLDKLRRAAGGALADHDADSDSNANEAAGGNGGALAAKASDEPNAEAPTSDAEGHEEDGPTGDAIA